MERWNSFRRFISQQHAELTSNQKFHHGKWHLVIVNCPCSPPITHCCDFQSFVTDEQCCKPYRPFKLLVFKIAKMILIVFMKNPQKIPNFSSEHENDINKIFVFYVTLKYSHSALRNRI